MEITVETVMTGHELRADILARYGGREALRDRAKGGDTWADHELELLDLMDADPDRLDHVYRTGESIRVDEREFNLTPPRLRIISAVRRAAQRPHGPLALTDLARRVKRDKKNVSNDVAKLERWGLLRTRREGARKLILPGGTEIRLVL